MDDFPEKNNKRALRIHHKNRIKRKVKRWVKKVYKTFVPYYDYDKVAAKLSTCPKKCSCDMCCNPRKSLHKDTLQEELNKIEFKEELRNL